MYLIRQISILVLFLTVLRPTTIDSLDIKPNIILITPNLFRVPSATELQPEDTPSQQYVALINKAHEREYKQLRQTYPKLALQVRDARQSLTGQLFYEHVFEYFDYNQSSLLIPIDLRNVSLSEPSILFSANDQNYDHQRDGDKIQYQLPIQQVIVSIRPHQVSTGFGGDNLELFSSAPIPLERIASSDGLKNFAFIQTDKPIYRPDEKVKIRALILNELMKPISSDDVKIQVRNPHNIIVEERKFTTIVDSEVNYATNFNSDHDIMNEPSAQVDHKQLLHNRLYLDHEFEFPPEPMLGIWTAQILHQDVSTNDTVSFEVKEYVLPTFKIDFSSPKYILPSTKEVDGSISVKYHHGKPVKGKAFFKFGYKTFTNPQIVYIGRSLIKTIEDNGVVTYKFSVEKIKQTLWYPGITGARFVVEASISEQSTGHHEVGTDTSCIFLSSPYKISLENSIDDFKPGIKQKLTAELFELSTDRPAPVNLKVTAHYSHPNGTALSSNSDTMAVTDSQGRVNFNIGPLNEDINTLQVTLRWSNNTSTPPKDNVNSLTYEQTTVIHTMSKHSSNGGWILIMNKGTISLEIGQVFQSDIMMKDAVISPKKIFYVVVSRGQIIQLNSLDADGFIRFTTTQQMVPSVRIVLFGISGANDELISDSMKLSIKQPIDCGLKLSYINNQGKEFVHENNARMRSDIMVKPNEKGKLIISGNIGDHVSLIGIDNGINALRKNVNHLVVAKIIERIKPLDTGCGFGGGRDNLDVFSNAGLMVFSDSYQVNFGNYASSAGPMQSLSNKFTNSNDIRDVIRDGISPYLGSVCQSMMHQIRYNENYQRGYNKALIYYSRRLNSISMPHSATPNIEVGQKSGFDINISPDIEQSKRQQNRHRRDTRSLLRQHSTSEDEYHCCLLGTIYDIQKRSCNVRALIVRKYMPDNLRCHQVYLDCCRRTFEVKQMMMSAMFLSGKSGKPDYSRMDESTSAEVILNPGKLDAIESDTLIRHDFRETWLFDLVSITQSSKKTSLDVRMPHSITTWSLSAMSMNLNRPICILNEPMRLISFQDLFLHVSLPYKVVQGEQLDVVATVFNYGPQTRRVVVYTYGIEGVCSESDPEDRSDLQWVTVHSHSSQSVLFPMIPLRVGKFPIKIIAVYNDNASDAIIKILNVVARGSPVEDHVTFHLDPKNHQHRFKRAIETGNLVDVIDAANGLQRSKVRLLPSRNADYIVPQTQQCIVSAIGDKIGPTAKTTLNDVEHLIRLPHGCGEQVMIYLGPTLYTTRYLQTIGKLSGESRWKAIKYIQNGYKRVLGFRKEDGSFSAFVQRDSSIWLTAFVMKMLCQTERTPFVSDQIHIDEHVIVSGLKWLLKRQYPSTGMWVELSPVYHREMLGGILKENTLTAFVVITLNECSHHSHQLISEVPITNRSGSDTDEERKQPTGEDQQILTNGRNDYQLALNRAEEAIFVNKFKAVGKRNAYVLALSAYALSFNRPQDASAIINDLMIISNHDSDKNWLSWRGDHITETAGYALLALLELQPTLTGSSGSAGTYRLSSGSKLESHNPIGDAQAIVNWLNSRRSFTGSFDSTQDTIVALEALSKFAQYQAMPTGGQPLSSPIDLMCNVTINNRLKRSIELRKENALVLQQFRLDSFNLDQNSTETLEFYTSGNGVGLMSVKLKYNILQDGNDLCRFDIYSEIEEWTPVSGSEMSNNAPEFSNKFNPSMLSELNVADSPLSGEPSTGLNRENTSELSLSQSTSSTPKRVARFAALRSVVDLVFNGSTNNSTNQNKTALGTPYEEGGDELDWTHRFANSIGVGKWFRGTSRRATSTTTLTPLTTNQSERYTQTENNTQSTNGVIQYIDGSVSTTPPGAPPSTAYATTTDVPNESRRISAVNLNVGNQPGPNVPSIPPMVRTSNRASNSLINNLSDKLEINSNQSNPSTHNRHKEQQYSPNRNRLVLLLKVCARTLGNRDSEMSVIEVGILSGFRANEADLNEITAKQPALKYELSSDKSLVIFYMEYIPAAGPFCMQFRIIRESTVYNLQSGHVRVYDYYQPTSIVDHRPSSCSNFYTPTRVSDQLETKCDQMTGTCKCAVQSICPRTHRLREVGEIFGVNEFRGREKFKQLVCSTKYDFVTVARLVNITIRSLTSGQTYLFSGQRYLFDVKPIYDLRGNISRVVQEQSSYRPLINPSSGSDHMTLELDGSCIKKDTTLLHFAHSKEFNLQGENEQPNILIFGRWDQLEKRYVTTPAQTTNGKQPPASNDNPLLDFSRKYPFTFVQTIDEKSIIFDINFQTDSVKFADNIKTLAIWLKHNVNKVNWSCQDYNPVKS